jgi:hypothetical protein
MVPLQFPPKRLLAMMLFLTVAVPKFAIPPLPPVTVELSEKVLFMTASDAPPLLPMPPEEPPSLPE